MAYISIARRFALRGYIATMHLVARRGETIELAVLGLLHEGPMHGYELRKRLNLMLGWGRVLSYGSLYPTLKKMLRSNLIEEAAVSSTPVTKPFLTESPRPQHFHAPFCTMAGGDQDPLFAPPPERG